MLSASAAVSRFHVGRRDEHFATQIDLAARARSGLIVHQMASQLPSNVASRSFDSEGISLKDRVVVARRRGAPMSWLAWLRPHLDARQPFGTNPGLVSNGFPGRLVGRIAASGAKAAKLECQTHFGSRYSTRSLGELEGSSPTFTVIPTIATARQ
jgi:hypothetical protein